MRQNFDNPAFLYQATRIYLMLGSRRARLDRGSVKAWMHYEWSASYPGPRQAALRQSLERHLAAMLDQPLPQVTWTARWWRMRGAPSAASRWRSGFMPSIQQSPAGDGVAAVAAIGCAGRLRCGRVRPRAPASR